MMTKSVRTKPGYLVIYAGAAAGVLWTLAGILAPVTAYEPPVVAQRGQPAARTPEVTFEEHRRREIERLRALVPEWRRQFAYRSLAERLQYERSRQIAVPSQLSEASKAALANDDGRGDPHALSAWAAASGRTRAESLRLLHSESVDEFVNRAGFGMSRMPRIGPDSVEHPSAQPLPLPKYSELSAAENSVGPRPLPVAPTRPAERNAVPRSDAPLIPGNVWLLPSTDDAAMFHDRARSSFASPPSFGHVESVDRVAGFVAHGLGYPHPPRDLAKPNIPGRPEETWKIARLELVSLLKHDEPRVYLSEHLPKMDELVSAKTRELNSFETSALEKIAAGEELEAAATPNEIVMLGALRAGKSCLQCHGVPHGALLGAFSYELRRSPPIVVSKAIGVTQ